MACELTWTASARADAQRILHHIAVTLDSPKAASEHMDAFLEVGDRISELLESSDIGAHPSLSRRNVRPCYVKSHVVLYSYDGNEGLVHRVFHTLHDCARVIGRED